MNWLSSSWCCSSTSLAFQWAGWWPEMGVSHAASPLQTASARDLLDNRTSYTVAQEHQNDCQAWAEGWSPRLAQPCLGCILLGRVASPAQTTGGRGWYKDVSTQGREQSHRPPHGTKEETHIFTCASRFALRETYCSPASWFKTQ